MKCTVGTQGPRVVAEDFYDENVFGQKTFCHTIGFDPCNERQHPEVMHWKVDKGPVVTSRMFFKKNVQGDGVNLDGFSLQRDEVLEALVLVVGFEKGTWFSTNWYQNLPHHKHALDVKGVAACKPAFAARPSNTIAGKPYSK